jgi:hypothetical protein
MVAMATKKSNKPVEEPVVEADDAAVVEETQEEAPAEVEADEVEDVEPEEADDDDDVVEAVAEEAAVEAPVEVAADADARITMPNATDVERAASLPLNDKLTAELTSKKAAKAAGVDESAVIACAVRGTTGTGLYVVVVTASGVKHAVRTSN